MAVIDEIASRDAAPIGGATAAFAGCLRLGLSYKVLLIEMNREELDPAPQATLRVAQKEIERIFLDLKRMVNQDSECYQLFRASHRSGRRVESKSFFLNVVTCSILVIERAFEGLKRASKRSKIPSPRLAPRVQVAVELLSAAMVGTSHVTKTNLKPLRSEKKRLGYLRNIESLCREGYAREKGAIEAISVNLESGHHNRPASEQINIVPRLEGPMERGT